VQSRRSVRHGARSATSFEGLGFAHSMADAERSSGTASLKDRRSREAAEDRALEAAGDRWPETSGASGTPWLGKRATRSLLALGRRSDGTRRRRPATRQSTSGCRAATVSREAWSSPRAAEEVAAVGRSSPRAAEEVEALAWSSRRAVEEVEALARSSRRAVEELEALAWSSRRAVEELEALA
jgi:hypothetical protein